MSDSPITQFREFLLEHFKGSKVHFDNIKNATKSHFPDICNDSVLCIHEKPFRPEWEHQLRHALDYLKNKQKVISQDKPGEYIFP